jgi:hypothetical protein
MWARRRTNRFKTPLEVVVANENIEIMVSVEAIASKAVAEFVKELFDKSGVKIDNVRIRWDDVSKLGRSRVVQVRSVELESSYRV